MNEYGSFFISQLYLLFLGNTSLVWYSQNLYPSNIIISCWVKPDNTGKALLDSGYWVLNNLQKWCKIFSRRKPFSRLLIDFWIERLPMLNFVIICATMIYNQLSRLLNRYCMVLRRKHRNISHGDSISFLFLELGWAWIFSTFLFIHWDTLSFKVDRTKTSIMRWEHMRAVSMQRDIINTEYP